MAPPAAAAPGASAAMMPSPSTPGVAAPRKAMVSTAAHRTASAPMLQVRDEERWQKESPKARGTRRPLHRSGSSRRFGALKALADTVAANSGRAPPMRDAAGTEVLIAALSAQPLFVGCAPEFVHEIVDKAERMDVRPGEFVALQGSLVVVETGALQISVGSLPPVVAGPGTVLNASGLLRGRQDLGPSPEADHHGLSASLSYERRRDPELPVPNVFDTAAWPQPNDPKIRFSGGLGGDAMCFYNLCPYAGTATVPDDSELEEDDVPAGDSSQLNIRGAVPGAVPMARCNRADFSKGGARLASISLKLVESIADRTSPDPAKDMAQSRKTFDANCKVIHGLWQAYTRRSAPFLPNVPAEALYALAEVSDWVSVPAGEYLVREGEGDESLLIIDEGEAEVAKWVGVTTSEAKGEVIGRIRPGAIVGDMCLIGGRVRRAAAVKALEDLRVVRIRGSALLSVLKRFPGVLAPLEHRLRKAAGFIREGSALQVRRAPEEGLKACQLFAGCSADFLKDLVPCAERHALCCGQVVRLEGDDLEVSSPANPDDEEEANIGTIYALEFGTCGLHVAGRGLVAEVHTGQWLEDDGTPGTEVCALTPIALVFTLRAQHLRAALRRHPAERDRLLRTLAAPGGGAIAQSVSKLELFRECGLGFVERVCDTMEARWYCPGQTVVVMGALDAGQMFLLRSGRLAVERNEKIAELPAGALFGELTMLGVVDLRTITIRALTVCSIFEISRATFLQLLEQFPFEKELFRQMHVRNETIVSLLSKLPIFCSAPKRLLLLLYLQSKRHVLPPGDRSLSAPGPKGSAIILLQGKADVVSASGEPLRPMSACESFNEESLLGTPNYEGSFVVPRTKCEVLVVAESAWRRVLPEFPETGDSDLGILDAIAEKAETRNGFEPGGVDVLRLSPLFRDAPADLLKELRGRVRDRICRPGEAVVAAGDARSCMFLLIDGTARIEWASLASRTGGAASDPAQEALEDSIPGSRLCSGSTFGEANMLRISPVHSHTVRAITCCIVQELHTEGFESVFAAAAGRTDLHETLSDVMRLRNRAPLERRIRAAFHACPDNFSGVACKDATEAFFAPGDVIISEGDPCHLTVSPGYVLLAGQLEVWSEGGVQRAPVARGELFGEAGALGLGAPAASVRAARDGGVVFCARLFGGSLHSALGGIGLTLGAAATRRSGGAGEAGESSPTAAAAEGPYLAALVGRRRPEVLELLRNRTRWFEESVLPALAASPLFAGWSAGVLASIVAVFSESTHAPGTTIVEAGQPGHSIYALLQGTARVEAASGMVVGVLRTGATFGELAALGLLTVAPASVRAGGQEGVPGCKILSLPSDAIRRILDTPSAARERDRFARLIECRKTQVEAGAPLAVMAISARTDRPCVRAVALHADQFHLPVGGFYHPLAATSPCGIHLGVLVEGQAVVEMAASGRSVMYLSVGAGPLLLPEDIIAAYGGRLRAASACCGYRLRRTDLLAIVNSMPTAPEWFYTLKMSEKQARSRFAARLSAACGASRAAERHPCDNEIETWKAIRVKSVEEALQLRRQRVLSNVLCEQESRWNASPTPTGYLQNS